MSSADLENKASQATTSGLREKSASGKERAFPPVPRNDLYFPGESIEECRGRIVRCLERGDGPAMVIGAAGMGKSLLLEVVAQNVAERFNVVRIASTQLCTRRALLQSILFGLGLPYQNRDEGELRLALVSGLEAGADRLAGTALLIDEAQALPVRLLEELRILSNLQRDGESLVRIVLAGNGALEEQFTSTELEAFNQRLAARCYLAPLSYGETHQYVRAHVAAAGGDPETTFTTGAIDSVYSASDGVPRLVNQVCDRALLMAEDRGAKTIDQGLIQAAWSDLHQLPAPWHTPEPTLASPESDVIEFGVLPGGEDEEAAIEELTGAAYATTVFDGEPELPLPAETTTTDGDWNADAALWEVAHLAKTVDKTLDEIEGAVEEACDKNRAPKDRWKFEECEQEQAINAPQEAAEPQAPEHAQEVSLDERIAEERRVDPEPSAAAVEDLQEELAYDLTPDAATLFGQEFEEEEIVIDRFASLRAVVSPTAPLVTNSEDKGFGALVKEHVLEEPVAKEADESLADDCIDWSDTAEDLDDTINVYSLSGEVDSEDDGEQSGVLRGPRAGSEDDSDVLIIEPDAPAEGEALEGGLGAPAVHRQEYRQLFANLRRS